MVAQVTAAALASENKSLAHPASVDSIPTTVDHEDFVSMATFAARSLADNVEAILAIELLDACHSMEFPRPGRFSAVLEDVHARIRRLVAAYAVDRFFALDIAAVKAFVLSGEVRSFLPPGITHTPPPNQHMETPHGQF